MIDFKVSPRVTGLVPDSPARRGGLGPFVSQLQGLVAIRIVNWPWLGARADIHRLGPGPRLSWGRAGLVDIAGDGDGAGYG